MLPANHIRFSGKIDYHTKDLLAESFWDRYEIFQEYNDLPVITLLVSVINF